MAIFDILVYSMIGITVIGALSYILINKSTSNVCNHTSSGELIIGLGLIVYDVPTKRRRAVLPPEEKPEQKPD